MSDQKKSIFLGTTTLALLVLFLSGIGIWYGIFHYNEQNINTYHELMAEANPTLTHKADRAPYTATQQQQRVRKDFFLSKGSDRLHFLLTSDHVDLILDHQGGKTELTEVLSDINCCAQQDLFYTDQEGKRLAKGDSRSVEKQRIYFCKADRGFFCYENSVFKAERVHATVYEALGHKLTSEMLTYQPDSNLYSIDAEQALYDGSNFALQGAVYLESQMGCISAEKLMIQPKLHLKEGFFDTILLKKDVIFSLKDKGVLTCQKAKFDSNHSKGTFYGSRSDPFVVFQIEANKEQGKPFMSLKSLHMKLDLAKNKEKDSKNKIDRLIAEGNVETRYGSESILYSDKAEYKYGKEGLTAQSFQKLPGKIIFTSNQGQLCRFEQVNGNQLTGSNITLDTNIKLLSVKNVKGFMHGSSNDFFPSQNNNHSKENSIEFKADSLEWDLSKDLLALKENVEVKHSDLGLYKSDKELKIFYSEIDGKRELSRIESDGHSAICHVQELKQHCHWLTCYGKMLIDHKKMEAVLQSPLNAQGKVPKGQQVFYYDHLGEVQADKATITYQMVSGRLIASKIILEGNVYLIDHKGMEAGESQKKPLHYALADRVEYTPHNKEIYFSSQDGRRVLFYDKINQLQVSAPALRITRDQQTKKESIKGIGDVRFHFKNSELDQLLKRNTTL